LKVAIGSSGSIGVVNLPQYLVELQKIDCDINVVMSESSLKFLQPLVVESLIGADRVMTDAMQKETGEALHMKLINWCDLFIVLPATANTIGKIANGIADNVLTTAVIACTKPVIIVPNMNENMWASKIVRNNVDTLKTCDFTVLEPTLQNTYISSEKGYKETQSMIQPKQLSKIVEHLLEGSFIESKRKEPAL
jgi:phosphopantothenoylcysteine decarboxylase/phosphopantothenate--cysteine ligase